MVPRLEPLIADTVHLVHEALDARPARAVRGRAGDVPRPRPRHLSVRHVVEPDRRRRVHRRRRRAARDRPRRSASSKAYTTRVGAGPVPDRAVRGDAVGDLLVDRGHEFGTNTGRRRRPGWLDARDAAPRGAAQHAAASSRSPSSTCSTPLDELKVCVAYEGDDGTRYDHVPYHQSVLHKVRPVYETLPGWQTEIDRGPSASRTCPAAARDYVRVHRGATSACRSASSASVPAASRRSCCPAPRDAASCVVGGGGREHALALGAGALASVDEVVATPGQPRHRPSSVRAGRPDDPARSPSSPTTSTPTSSSSAPRSRSSTGVADAVRARGPPRVRARRRRRAPRGLEGVDEGGARRGRRPHRAPRARSARRRGRRARVPRDAAPASTSSRPTASPRARACSSPSRSPRRATRCARYLSGEAFGDAGRTLVIEEGLTRPRAVAARGVRRRRRRRGAARAGPGLQAHRRRRHRPEHRRHGRVLAGADRRRRRSSTQVMDRRRRPTLARARARAASSTAASSTPG